jgi:hypothetical protein
MMYVTTPNKDSTPWIGEIRKAVRLTRESGYGWEAKFRHSYHWTRNSAMTKVVKKSGVRHTIRPVRVVWTGKGWSLIGETVRPK